MVIGCWRGTAAVVLVLGGVSAGGAAPEIWNANAADRAALDKAWHELSAPLRPAIQFQRVLLRIRAGAPMPEWREGVAKFASATGDDAVTSGLGELARAWLARAAMEQIDQALRGYYRKHVRFPETLEEVQSEIPDSAKRDPWDEPWSYQAVAPKGLSKGARQRYQLGPQRYPRLSTREQVIEGTWSPPNWKLTARTLAGSSVLEFRGADGKAAAVQPGGRFEETTLLFIGDGWALLADTERLFTLRFE